jgi:predicted O-methyltransferase YrrM
MPNTSKLRRRLAYAARDPLAAWARFLDAMYSGYENSRPPVIYEPDPDWDRRLHEWLGAEWPCPAAEELRELWPKIAALVAAKGYRFGPESYFGWNDADPELVRAIWCLVRHRRPSVVVETGVGHGISSRFILEALERNGEGRLRSVDQLNLDPVAAAEVGLAVDGFAPERWRLVAGPTRRVLPDLLEKLETVDLFLHDSLHTERNVLFEVGQAYRFLRHGGFVVIDDIDANWGFRALMTRYPGDRFLICQSEPVCPDLRRFNQKGLFGIIQYAPAAGGRG